MINIDAITLKIAGKSLIESGTVSLPTGIKAGLVGRNGTGKTTLFKAMTGDLELETGEISLPRHARIGQVAQEAPGTDEALIDIVLAADIERANLLAESETSTDPTRLAEIHARLGDIDSHSAPSRASRILSGLGFDEAAQHRAAKDFSGGWRMRVALAAMLFSKPDILLLDEPTNYLDMEGTLWLQDHLARLDATVIIISHDRDLLNKAVNSIVHLENRKLKLYRGSYDSFAEQYARDRELNEKARQKQEARTRHMMKFVDRFRYKATKAKQAQSRLKAIEKMAPIVSNAVANVSAIKFPDPERMPSSPIIRMEMVSTGYSSDQPVLRGLDLRIDNDDRIAMLGANGNGKSTFAKLLCDRMEHVNGELVRADKLRVAMFAQHQLDDLVASQTPVDHVRAVMGGAGEAKVRARVADMGLGQERMDTKACDLSGGEKARLLLGMISFNAPHLLILDEPTNHLDMESRQALIEALNDFSGAVILISHDRHLVEATVDRLWIVGEGGVKPYDGDMESYAREVLGREGKTKDTESAAKSKRRQQRAENAKGRVALAPLRQKLQTFEKQMKLVDAHLAKIDAELATPNIYDAKPQRAIKLGQARAIAQSKIAELEESWMEVGAIIEKNGG